MNGEGRFNYEFLNFNYFPKKQKRTLRFGVKYLLTCFLLSLTFLSKAQPNTYSSITRARVDKYYIGSYLKDYRDIITYPFVKPSIKKYSLMAAYGGSMYILISTYDEKIQSLSQKHKYIALDKTSKYILEPFGRGIYPFSAIILLYAEGVIWKNQKSKKVAMEATKSFLIANSFTQVAKYTATRQRPYILPSDAQKWNMGGDNHSFFSGHTTTAFSIATVFAEEYKETVWVPIVAYTLATGTGLSRIYDNKHWTSDVLTGALCGYLIGKLVVKENNWGIKVIPRLIIE